MNKKNNIIYIVLAAFTTLLFADRFMVYGIVLLVMLYFGGYGKNLVLYRSILLYVFIAIFVVTLIAEVLSPTGFSSIYNVSIGRKEICRAIIYIIVMELIMTMEVDLKIYSWIWKILLFFIVGVAIIQFTKVFDIDSILKNIYGDSVQFYNSAKTELSTFRCGSVFINPNVFACFLVAALANYLFVMKYKYESVMMKIITFGTIIIGFILSGSRTGLVLAVIIILTYIYNSKSSGENIAIILRNILFMLAGIVAVFGIFVVLFDFPLPDFSTFRAFKIKDGTYDSLGNKIDIFINLLLNMNPVNMVVGYGPFNYASDSRLMVDFDFGYFVTFYGLAGVFIYFILLRGIYKWGNTGLTGRVFINRMFVVITIFFGITAGVYFNLRIFAIYMLMFLPIIRANDEIIA